ncbi:MAG: uroporphyrinogen-III synthase [Paracoccaceae bacterium]|nr:uroporphyrinogen-III synthase [Paracoccaceae bacterium]
MVDQLPLLLMTRPRAASERFLAELSTECAPILSPLIGFTVTGPLPDLAGVRGVIFTSANGVAAYQALGGPTHFPAFAVGAATAAAAREVGLEVTSADGDAEALIAMISQRHPQGPLLHIRGTHGRGDVAARLTALGVPTQAAILYDQPEIPATEAAKTALSGTRPVVAPVFSPRTGALLAKLPVKAPLLVAAMSEAVVKSLAPLHIRESSIAERPDAASMAACTGALLAQARALEADQGEL